MAFHKAASMTNLGTKSCAGKQRRQFSFGLDSELTRESAEEMKHDDFNDVSHRRQRRASTDANGTTRADRLTSRVLPKRTMAGRMAVSVRRRFTIGSKKDFASDTHVDRTAESVESDCSAW